MCIRDRGSKVAIFSAIEVKDKGKTTVDQKNFLNIINNSGGYAGVARNINDAKQILDIV